MSNVPTYPAAKRQRTDNATTTKNSVMTFVRNCLRSIGTILMDVEPPKEEDIADGMSHFYFNVFFSLYL